MNKIYGVVTDIVDITRIKKSIKNKKFINKIFSDREIKNSKNKLDSYYAKRFAAKEAFSKALGTGISEGISFNEISILNNDKGQPYIELLGKTKIIVNKKIKKRKIFLSLSDEKKYAIATVIIN